MKLLELPVVEWRHHLISTTACRKSPVKLLKPPWSFFNLILYLLYRDVFHYQTSWTEHLYFIINYNVRKLSQVKERLFVRPIFINRQLCWVIFKDNSRNPSNLAIFYQRYFTQYAMIAAHKERLRLNLWWNKFPAIIKQGWDRAKLWKAGDEIQLKLAPGIKTMTYYLQSNWEKEMNLRLCSELMKKHFKSAKEMNLGKKKEKAWEMILSKNQRKWKK